MSYLNKKFNHNSLRKIILFFTCLLYLLPSHASEDIQNNSVLKTKAHQLMGQQKPLSFKENKGQMADIKGNPAPYVLYKAEAPDFNIWVTTGGITYQFFRVEEDEERETGRERGKEEVGEKIECEWHRVDMLLKGADIRKENIIAESDVTQGKVNYYLAHCPDGIFNVKSYSRITIKNVYQGIDWVLYTSAGKNGNGFKHEFVLHPGADPSKIKLIYEGSGELNIDNSLIKIKTELGELAEGDLLCYQGEENNEIFSQYTIKETGKNIENGFSYEVGIQTGNYNTRETLIIDPQLVWGTYFGYNNLDGFSAAALDGNGNFFITGYVSSLDFPTVDPGGAYYQATNSSINDMADAFILKFDNNGQIIWSTYYGGTNDDRGNSIATDAGGNVFISGWTGSNTDFPLWDYGGGAYYQPVFGGGFCDIIILKFDNNGQRLWATYYGGSDTDMGYSLATDASGNIFITGYTLSQDFPVQAYGVGAYYQPSCASGPGQGADAFILKFTNLGVSLWATYYGGSDNDNATSIITDTGDNMFITGNTGSSNFPVLDYGGAAYFQTTNAGVIDAFILKFTNIGEPLWATYYGGNGVEFGFSIAKDKNDNIYITGYSFNSTNFPVLDYGGYYQPANVGSQDIFILRFTDLGIPLWATYYGGSDDDNFENEREYKIATDKDNNLYITGKTKSIDFPVLDPGGCAYFQGEKAGIAGIEDVFIIKFDSNAELSWATYSGTPDGDFGAGIVTDTNGCMITIGEWFGTGSNGLLDPGGTTYYSGVFAGTHDSYIMKFCPPVGPVADFYCSDSAICAGSCIDFFDLTTNLPISWNWAFTGATPDTSNDQNPTSICYNTPGVFPVTLIAANCDSTDTITKTDLITVYALPEIEIDGSTIVCEGTDTTLKVTGGLNYLWNTGATIDSIIVTPVVMTTYTVTGIDNNNCANTDEIVITINYLPSVDLGTDTCIESGETIVLNAGTGYTYSWCNNSTSQTYTVTEEGNYWVIATNNCGTDVDSVNIIPCPSSVLYIPNSFTPNGDNRNDMFIPVYTNITEFEMYVFNRWGQEIFHTTDINEGWNGKYKGELCPQGVYTWLVFYKGIDDTEKQKKYGYVTLLR